MMKPLILLSFLSLLLLAPKLNYYIQMLDSKGKVVCKS